MSALAAGLGISSGIINTVGLLPYIRDTIKGKTKPERATWWIWLALNLIAFSAQIAAGATWSLLYTAANILGVGITAGLSIHYGYGTFARKDLIALLIAMLGLVLWKFTHQPLAALAIVIAIDAVGYYLLVTKTWEAPQTETLVSWQLAAVASALGVFSVMNLNFTRLLYPAYVLAGDLAIVTVIMIRRRELETVLSP